MTSRRSDAGFKQYLQALSDQLPIRDAAEALGYSRTSNTPVKELFLLYGVKQSDHRYASGHAVGEGLGQEAAPKEGTAINPDGTQEDTRNIPLTDEELRSPECLLRAHGYDPKAFRLVKHSSAKWDAMTALGSSKGETVQMYSSRITVEPLGEGAFDLDAIMDALGTVAPVRIPKAAARGKREGMLLVPFFDMHWKGDETEGFRRTLDETVALIRQGWEEVVFPVGSDLFHNDNLRSSTAKGTPIEGMDWTGAWAGAATFYSTLLAEATANSVSVRILYVKGNHDESMAWPFCHMLATMFPDAAADLGLSERKVVTYGPDVAYGILHGDKGKDFGQVFNAESREFRLAIHREVLTGHVHHEVVDDKYGILERKLPTGCESDQWTDDKGYKHVSRFQVLRATRDRGTVGTDYV